MPKRNFCIITGINYFAKAITMYESLLNNGVDFKLYYVAFDKSTLMCLRELNYFNIIPIVLSDIEDKELRAIKKKRKLNEYYFTLTPSIILYIIQKYELKECIYLDADLYFYQSPEILLSEMYNDSVLLTRHHPTFDVLLKEGKYCVQFLPFKNDYTGIEILKWWRAKCIDWCQIEAIEGKWADQGYLNDWPTRFNNIHVLNNFGAVGPWNLAPSLSFFKVISRNNKPAGLIFNSIEVFPIVFYHFQGLKILHDWTIQYSSSITLDDSSLKYIYTPYVEHLLKVGDQLSIQFPGRNVLGKIPKPKSIKSIIELFNKEKSLKNITSAINNKVLIFFNIKRS